MADDKLDFIDEKAEKPEPKAEKAEKAEKAKLPDPVEAKGEKPEPQEADKAEKAEKEDAEPAGDKAEPKEAKSDAKAAPPAATDEKGQQIPITALLDEREKRQAAERKLQEMEAWRRELEQRQQAAPQFSKDPEQRLAFERQNFQQSLWNEKLNMSEVMARDKFGDETVDAARDAFVAATKSNPSLYAMMQRELNPYGFVVSWHKREQAMAEIGADPMAWKAKQVDGLREQIRQEILAEMQGATPSSSQRPPGSLANAPAAGKAGEPRPSGSAFDAMFGG